VHMRSEISKLHRSVDKTFIYVTHDQIEAMTMGTRIVVLRDGMVLQHDEPQVIFQRPANVFVARFIGSPPMNVLPCRISAGGALEIGGLVLSLPADLADIVTRNGLAGREVLLGVRPERVIVDGSSVDGLSAEVTGTEHLGSETLVYLGLDTDAGGEPAEVVARLAGEVVVPEGPAHISLDLSGACLFDPDSEARFPGSAG